MSEIQRIAIITAMDCELEEFRNSLTKVAIEDWNGFRFYLGLLNNYPVVLVKTGVGKVLSSMITQYILDKFKPSHIFFCGLAGALNPKYEVADVVIAIDCIQYDLDASPLGFSRGQIPYTELKIIRTDEKLKQIALEYIPVGHKIHEGRILTGDQFIVVSADDSHKYLVSELGGDAVDMEGASVALVCQINQVPCLIVRTISDRADGTAHIDMNKFLPEASRNSLGVVIHVLEKISEGAT